MRHVRWVNFYPPTDGNGPRRWATTSWNRRQWADDHAGLGRLACVRVEFCDGHGLSDADQRTMVAEAAEAVLIDENARLREAKKAAARVADARSIENVELRAENERLRGIIAASANRGRNAVVPLVFLGWDLAKRTSRIGVKMKRRRTATRYGGLHHF